MSEIQHFPSAFNISKEEHQADINQVTQEQVINNLHRCHETGQVDPNLERMVRLYPNWKYTEINSQEIGHLTWYFKPEDPDHISQQLTDQGKHRQIEDVAQKYNEIGFANLSQSWDGAAKIESLCQALENHQQLPPVVIVPGARYPDSPDSSIIDGVHRLLATSVYHLRTQDEDITLNAYIGRKANPLHRLVSKFR